MSRKIGEVPRLHSLQSDPQFDMAPYYIQDRRESSFLDSALNQYPNPYFHMPDLQTFMEDIKARVIANPTEPVMLFGIGPPGEGKTTILKKMIKKLLGKDSDIRLFAKEFGYDLNNYNLPWGGAFGDIEDYVRVESNYDMGDTVKRFRKLAEMEKAEENYANAVRKILIDTERKNRVVVDADGNKLPSKQQITVITGDVVVVSGMREETKNDLVGMPKGGMVLRDIVNHTGKFAGLPYGEVSIFGVSADEVVRANSFVDRLVGDGKSAHTLDLIEINKDVAAVVYYLWKNGYIKFKFPGNITSYIDIYNVFQADPDVRARVLGSEVTPWIMRDVIKIPSCQENFTGINTTAATFYNQHVDIDPNENDDEDVETIDPLGQYKPIP